MKLIGCMVSTLLGPIVAVIAVVKFIGVLLTAFLGFVAVGAALIAYLKREQWTKPAYRWARDTSGRWNMTPWTPTDKTAS